MDALMHATTVLSILLLAMVLFSVRRAHIRVEYSVSWLLASLAMLVLSLSRPVLEAVTKWSGVPDTPLTLFLRFSIIISDLRDDNIALAQRVAMLEFHLRNIEDHEER